MNYEYMRNLLYVHRTRYKDEELIKAYNRFFDILTEEASLGIDHRDITLCYFIDIVNEMEYRNLVY